MDPDADLSPIVSRPRLQPSKSNSRRKDPFIAPGGIESSKPSSRRLKSHKTHTGNRSHSFTEDEEHQQHHRSHNSSSSGHHHDHTKRRHSGDSRRRSTEKQPSKLKNNNGIGKASKKISKLITPRRSSSTSSSSSKQKHRNVEHSHGNFSSLYEVFYDEDGQKIVIPRKKLPTKSASETEITPSEMKGRDHSHRSSQYNSDSDNSDSDRDDDSGCSSRIEGASDFEDDSIDGASEMENHEDEKTTERSEGHCQEKGYDNGDGRYHSADVIHSDEEEIIEYVDDDDSIISYQEQDTSSLHSNNKATKRSNSPELNINRKQTQPTKATMEQVARNFYSSPGRHRDPPMGIDEDQSILSRNNDINNMDPNEDDGATLRLDRPPTPESDRCNDIGDQLSQMTVRGRRDPPEQGKGCDPPHLPRFGTSPQNTKGRNTRKKELRGILKKKEGAAPPPVAYFGRASQSTSEHNSDSDSDDSGGSDPDITEVKSKGGNEDDTSETQSLFENNSVNTAKSGLRSGRFAEANAAAAAAATASSIVQTQTKETNDTKPSNTVDFHTSFPTLSDDENGFNRKKSYFMRTSDLGLTQDTIFPEQFLDNPKSRPKPHYHHPSPHPPDGERFNVDENWISIDDGNGTHSPIAPQAVDALVAAGYRCASDPLMWTPTSKTRKLMTDSGLCFDDIPTPASLEEEGGRGDSSCLVWSGKFLHKYHGHDLPVVRSQGVINMSAEHLVDLLMDSSRVQSYNVSSIGRTDVLILSDGTNLDTCPFSGQRRKKLTGVVIQGAKIVNGAAVGFEGDSDVELSDCEEEEGIDMDSKDGKGTVRTMTSHLLKEPQKSRFVGVTKIVKSTNKVPMRKSLEYNTLLHCRTLTDDQGGNGYIIVGRSVTPAEDACKGSKDTQRAEILLNVYIIRRLRDKKDKKEKRDRSSSKDRSKSKMRDRCVMICVSHVKSPIMPHLLAKKISLRAASSFITDIRALTEE